MFPTILATHHGDRVVLTICGELDLGTRQLLEERCAEVSTGDADLVLDLTGVSFVDCGSLRVLGHLLRSHGGRTHVLCPEGPVRRVLDLTGFSDLHDVRVGPTRRS